MKNKAWSGAGRFIPFAGHLHSAKLQLRMKFWICFISILCSANFISTSIHSQGKTSKVEVEVPILSGDAIAARDSSQSKAFEKALSEALPAEMSPELKSQRLKNPIKFIQSFRVVDEQRLGDSLKVTYEVEISASAFEMPTNSNPASATSGPPSFSGELQLDLVFQGAGGFPVAEVVDQINSQLKIPVTSFRLTRSAVNLKVKALKAEEEIIREIQNLLGARAKVNLVARIQDEAPPVAPVPVEANVLVGPPASSISTNSIVAPNAVQP